MRPLIDAATAAATLGVSRATLYTYVSRGLVAAMPDPADPRRRLYRASDVAGLAAAKARGRRPKAIAAAALDWGIAALPSRITLIAQGRMFYRGVDAIVLAGTADFEQAARLLWACDGADPFQAAAPPPASTVALPRGLAPFDRGRMCLAAADQPARDPAGLLRQVTAAMLGQAPAATPIDAQLAAAWQAPAGLLRTALVLLADHELNASTFAVRVVASTGASLAACLTAGLAALSGPLHGGATAAMEALFAAATRHDAATAVAALARREGILPAFGHPLYPDGDPRAALLLDRLAPHPLRQALLDAGTALTGQPPNIDFALAALSHALRLPPGAGLALFAVARSAGWIAHALEQREGRKLIRPRADYVGVQPPAPLAAHTKHSSVEVEKEDAS